MSKVHFSSIYSSFGNDPQNQSTALLAIAPRMISCISFLNHKGDVIIGRSYRDNVRFDVIALSACGPDRTERAVCSSRLADEFKNKILLTKGECLPIQ